MTTTSKINIWTEAGNWYFSAWVDGEHDTNGDLAGNVSEAEALDVARERFGDAEINVVEQTA